MKEVLPHAMNTALLIFILTTLLYHERRLTRIEGKVDAILRGLFNKRKKE